MKSLFITVRFDRMKNANLNALYKQLLNDSNYHKSNSPDILNAISRLEKCRSFTNVLHPKQRKQLHTAEITKLRAANNKLIIAIQFQLKALKSAQLDEDKQALFIVSEPLTKLLKSYKRDVILQKEITHFTLNLYLKNNPDFSDAFSALNLMRFVISV